MSKKIKKGDKVKILIGKDSGKEGNIERVLSAKNQVTVSGVNIYKRHVKKQGNLEGGIIDIVKPVNISNVVLVCPVCKKATRVNFKGEGRNKVRICKKCGKEIK